MPSRFTSAAVAAVLTAVLTGCGGGSDTAEQRPTATPTATEAGPAAPKGLDVAEINRARATFVEACRKRQQRGGEDVADVRRAARTLTRAFEANPDDPFRRSPNAPEVTMRDTLRALGTMARSGCGGGVAVAVGTRLRRAAARGAAG